MDSVTPTSNNGRRVQKRSIKVLIHFHLDLVGANLAKESRVTLIQNPELNNFSLRDAAIRISELKAIFLLTCLRLSSNLPRTFFFQEEKLRVRFFG